MVMMADCFPEHGQKSPKELGTSTVILSLYVPDCDAVWNQAVAAGATVRFPLMDQFWGDRYGQLRDPVRPQLVDRCACRQSADADVAGVDALWPNGSMR